MAKRFTDTEKWSRPWFRSLPIEYREFWSFILDKCDHAGVWYVDLGLASYMIGSPLDSSRALDLFEKQIEVVDGGSRWWIKDFVVFQYGAFSRGSKVHQSVLRTLQGHHLSWPSATPATGQGKARPRVALPRAYPQGNGKGGRQGNSEGKGAGIRSVGVRTAVAA